MASMDEGQFQQFLETVNDNIDDNDELFVAVAALVISVVALLASLLQVAQQYYASAAGFSNCDEKAIGKWSASTKRILKPAEFRFEVQYEAPVIFLCRPDNTSGPVKQQPIFFINGTDASLKDTRTEFKTKDSGPKTGPSDKSNKEIKQIFKQEVHTADNELASWVTLLTALQQMEHDSRTWQKGKYAEKKTSPPKDNAPVEAQVNIAEVLEEVESNYSLTVAVQRKLKSWDTMPSNVKKPYATTTWCHAVEMIALLGVYWVEFDRTNDRYRGEGNGYTVTGDKVSDLGIMFTFQVHGRNRFEANRVIPVDEVKELCFGFVPTIYKSQSDERRLKLPIDESRDLSTLNFASLPEIGETLVLIGCNTNTVNYFSAKAAARVSHLFPIAFEIVGMLAQTLHIEKSAFRLLPNPTLYRWDTKNFNLPKLLTAFALQLKKRCGGPENPNNSDVIRQISRHIKTLQDEISKHPPSESVNGLSLTLMDALHKALDDTDEVLTYRKKEQRPPPQREYTTMSKLNNRITEQQQQPHPKHQQHQKVRKETRLEIDRREKVRYVLRSHIQEVLAGFNTKLEKPTQDSSASEDTKTKSRFEAIDAATPERKQNKLMEVYFKTVLPKVMDEAQKSTERRVGEQAPLRTPVEPSADAPQGYGLRRSGRTGQTTRTVATVEYSETGSDEDEQLSEIEDEDDEASLVLQDVETTHGEIWCTLVFRMICWLMLHDFHKNDVQKVSKSELFGSRLPVYIA